MSQGLPLHGIRLTARVVKRRVFKAFRRLFCNYVCVPGSLTSLTRPEIQKKLAQVWDYRGTRDRCVGSVVTQTTLFAKLRRQYELDVMRQEESVSYEAFPQQALSWFRLSEQLLVADRWSIFSTATLIPRGAALATAPLVTPCI